MSIFKIRFRNRTNKSMSKNRTNEKNRFQALHLIIKQKKPDFENDKCDFCEHVITKNVERQLHISNEFTDFRNKNQFETKFTPNDRKKSNI